MAEQLPYILPEASSASQRTEASGLARELRTARRPGDYTQNLFDVARAFNKRVPMSRLVEIEPDLRPYLASIIIAALQKARETITVPADMPVNRVSQDDFDAHLMRLATRQYPTYGILEQLGPK